LAGQVVAGTTADNGSLKVKLAATREDIYVKDMTFRVNTNANDVAVQAITLYAAIGGGSLTQYGPALTLNTDSTNPGYVRLILEGENRIKVPKNGTTYLLVKPTYVSSMQAAVSSLAPAIFLADIQAEGVSVLTPSSSTPNLTIDTGIIPKPGNSALFGNSTKTLGAAVTSVAATTLTCTTAGIFGPGDIIFIDTYNAAGDKTPDTKFNSAYEEIMVVLIDNDPDLTVARGAFGTAPTVYDNTDKIYLLNQAGGIEGIVGNAMTVLNTKAELAVASDSPSGTSSGGTDKIIFKFTVKATKNSADLGDNKVVLDRIDITNTENSATVNDLKIYPFEYDQNASYVTNCGGLSASEWRCTMNTAGATNEILEDTTRTYVVRATTGYEANGNIQVTIPTLGTSDLSTNNVKWTDDYGTSIVWVDQSPTYIQGGVLTTAVASGTKDNISPTVASILVSGTADNQWTDDDTVKVTFSEVMDASLFVTTGGTGTLVPDGTYSVTAVPDTTGYLDRTAAASSESNIPGVFAADGWIIGGDTQASGDQAAAVVSLMLSTNGKEFTVKVTTAGALNPAAVAESYGSSNPSNATLKDVNANALATTAVTATGTGF